MKTRYILLFEKFLELEIEPEEKLEPIEKQNIGTVIIPGWQVY